jgi:uncharacterized protein with FMN-binding domain
MKKPGSNKKVANRLVAVSSAAVMAVYAAGYTRTRSAADQLEGQSAERRPAMPRPPRTTSPVADFPPTAISAVASAPSVAHDAAEKPVLMASVNPAPVKKANASDAAVSSVAPATTTPVVAPEPAPAAATAPAAPAPAVTQLALTPAQAALKAVMDAAAPPWKDGVYEGWGTCRHGDLSVNVVIEGGKITAAPVNKCLTRYSCDIIDKLPPQVVLKQSPDVSYVSGATQSTDAYYWAVVVALGKAK